MLKKIASRIGVMIGGNKPKEQARRGFNAAVQNRLTSSWSIHPTSLNYDLQKSLRIMQTRSRELFQNDPYAKKFLRMTKTNVVGPKGFNLQVKVKDVSVDSKTREQIEVIDKVASKAIATHFQKWARKGNCDVTGMHSFKDLQNLFISSVFREGECLFKKVYGKDAGPYGYALQVLDVDRLNTDYNRQLDNGGQIRMSIEINSYGRPVAYHVLSKHPNESNAYTYQGGTYQRIPANEIIHCFVVDRPEQVRGVPELHASMFRMQNQGAFEEAAIIASRVGASKMGFFTTPDGDGSLLADSQDSDGSLLTEADPGTFDVLPEGYKFESFNPDYPSGMYESFMKTCLRAVASGMGVSYNELANDLEGVNFSSMRSGSLSERDNWMQVQDWMIEHFLQPVFEDWLRFALINNAILLPNGNALPITKYDKFNAGEWKGRRWQWVDPRADTQANIDQVKNGFKSRSDVVAEQGRDFEDVANQLAQEKELIEKLGISEILSDQIITTVVNNQDDNQNS